MSATSTINGRERADSTDYMTQGFDLIDEPLNLRTGGQQWFRDILENETRNKSRGPALVLGATPWLASLLAETATRTVVVDSSASMLDLCERFCKSDVSPRHINFLKSDWQSLPHSGEISIATGDNSLSFLRFPDEWEQLLASIAGRMRPNGVVITRFLSAPAGHRKSLPIEIIENALARSKPVNFTALRAALLFAQWHPKKFCISTEAALADFVKARSDFVRLLNLGPGTARNDLLTMEKYRGTRATYFAPPISQAIGVFEKSFQVIAVHFGRYEMSQYFPLVVAEKRP